MTARLIAFCSPAMGSGKSTAAEYLVEHYGFKRLAFGSALKAMCDALLREAGMAPDERVERIYGSRKEDVIPFLGMTSRRLQQLTGTDFGRNMVHPDIWVNITLAKAKSYLERGVSVVVDDMRFPNEYHAVVTAGGECRRIVRPSASVTSQHASEGQLDRVHMPEIWNDAGVSKLHRALDALAAPVKSR